ncbi:MAG TPA: transcription termination/antitermination protein NusA [Candidatus Magasanikbacteria bacterium]|uniref:Transcription termination/antitermination protein NusA n=2 Tax=Candidatus Magasanikiibacteriota TaxID=1752731 RepID=A0A0G0WML0_9BACT|nr:MAG: Transcription termination factor NusA [Candidatus Magasanikbacteria bacterium GW2011_GWC2_41_17]KKS13322.1 MAG: Transcription termination factor NusA [Candidatus Magasanikbacteria bacterium GW2011_GWA2_41_55]HBV57993.1 transcription termination/antitermination protein NusA [Candidatus Magasanikbacteria bacterium]HBX16323.1 transcription termination/antitermination protein NusA [Candidatus Magasanikbacteria bacterium]
MASPITQAIKQICEEKNLSYEAVLETVQTALAAAYRKDFGEKNQNVQVEFNPETGEMKAFDVKTVVEDVDLEAETVEWEKVKAEHDELVKKAEEKGESMPEPLVFKRFNPKTEWMISEAKIEYPKAKIDEVFRRPLEIPTAFGRMAAQTAKQVIIQKLREAERDMVYQEFKGREGELLVGTVGRREGRLVLVDVGKATAVLPPEEQIEMERYNPGSKIKVYVLGVNLTQRGSEIRVSRTHSEMVKKIFETEIPEVASGSVEIKGIARDAGSRSKVAVFAKEENIDPIGSCIGQRGSRIQTIISELGGEKIDIIAFDENQEKYIANALSPAKVLSVNFHEESKSAMVQVVPDQYSLAIGRGGQNVHLASRLTGWQVMVEQVGGGVEAAVETPAAEAVLVEPVATEKIESEIKEETKSNETKIVE